MHWFVGRSSRAFWITERWRLIPILFVENRVRPIAIGRKNYLFAGSHEAAQRATILYSLLNTCTLHGVNPQEWLVDVLKRIDTMAEEEMYTLLPQHWKAAQDTALPQAA